MFSHQSRSTCVGLAVDEMPELTMKPLINTRNIENKTKQNLEKFKINKTFKKNFIIKNLKFEILKLINED